MITWLAQFVEHPWGQRLGWALLHSLWQGAAAAFLLGAALRLLRNRSSQSRWLAACATLACLALAPVVPACLVTIDPHSTSALERIAAISDSRPELIAVSSPERSSLAAPAGADERRPLPPREEAQQVAPIQDSSSTSSESRAWSFRISQKLQPMLPWIVLAWLIGVTAMSLWHLGGWFLLEWTKRRLTQTPAAEVVDLFERLRCRLRFSRPVRLLESAVVKAPMVIGALRPAILLPLGILSGLTPSQLEAVLAHELAHIRRHDYLVGLLQAAVETLMFYHPAVWWISARIRQEAEECCDSWTLEACPDRKNYAAALLRAAEWAEGRKGFAIAATGGKLAHRIRRILELPATETNSRRWPAAFLLTAAILVVCFALPKEKEQAVAEQPVAEKAAAGKYDHFFYLRHNAVNGAAKTSSLILVKATADGFEEREILAMRNLHLGWRPLLVRGGKLYAIHVDALLRIDIASGKMERIDNRVGYHWQHAAKLYAAVVDKELRIYDLANEAYRDVAAPDWLRNGFPRTIKVSPDGRRVAFFKANTQGKRELGHLAGYNLHLLDLATGQSEEIGPEMHTVAYTIESPSLGGKPPPFAWLDANTILTFREAPGPVIGLSPEGNVLTPEIPCKATVLDLTSGKLTEIAPLPRWKLWNSQPHFRDPDAKGVPRFVLGELGQFRIDLQDKRLFEDDALRGEYRYRAGQSPQQIAIGKKVLAEGPQFDGVSVAPTGNAVIWQTGRDIKTAIWHHDANGGKVREVAQGWFPMAFDGWFIWARAEDLQPAPAPKAPDGWKAFSFIPYPAAPQKPEAGQTSGNLNTPLPASSGFAVADGTTTTNSGIATTGGKGSSGGTPFAYNGPRQLPAELAVPSNLDFETRELLLSSFSSPRRGYDSAELATFLDAELSAVQGADYRRIAEKLTVDIDGPEALRYFEALLQGTLKKDQEKVLEALADCMRREKAPQGALRLLISATTHADVEVRRGAVTRLVKFRDPKIKDAMEAALGDKDTSVAASAARYVAAYENLELIDWLAVAMSQPTRSRYFAAKAIVADLERVTSEKKGKLPDVEWPDAKGASATSTPGHNLILIEYDHLRGAPTLNSNKKEKPPEVGWPKAHAEAFDLYRQTLRNWLAWALQHPRDSERYFDVDRKTWKMK